jgi:hypothetical protein
MTAETDAELSLQTGITADPKRTKDASFFVHQHHIRNDLFEARIKLSVAAQSGFERTENRIDQTFRLVGIALFEDAFQFLGIYAHDQRIAVFLFSSSLFIFVPSRIVWFRPAAYRFQSDRIAGLFPCDSVRQHPACRIRASDSPIKESTSERL